MQTSLLNRLIRVVLGGSVTATLVAACGSSKTDLFADQDASAGGTTGAGGSGESTPDGGVVVGRTPCDSDKVCRPKGQLCDLSRAVCVDCLTANDCGMNKECNGGSCVAFTPCTSSLMCPMDQVCDQQAKRCVECVVQGDCKNGQACIDHTCRASCSSDKDCRALSQLCDTAQMVCVECVKTDDCSASKYCVNHACVDRVCAPGSSVCRSTGVATCNAEGSAYGAPSVCPADSPCTEVGGKASCGGKDAGMAGCQGGPTVWFVISRSGAMFSSKFADTTTHWAAVLQAFSADGPLNDYASKMKIGVATFAGEMTTPACPDLMTAAPATGNTAAILAALSGTVKPTKGETPTTAAYTAVANMLQADASSSKFIVLIGDAAPDRCSDPSTYCAQDELVDAVQKAFASGIRTKIIGLPNGFVTQPLWTQFLQDVANAGSGQGVAYTGTSADEFQCNRMFKAHYTNEGGAPGTAAFSAPMSPAELTTAVGTALGSLGCP
jgi:hypothetical protein